MKAEGCYCAVFAYQISLAKKRYLVRPVASHDGKQCQNSKLEKTEERRSVYCFVFVVAVSWPWPLFCERAYSLSLLFFGASRNLNERAEKFDG